MDAIKALTTNPSIAIIRFDNIGDHVLFSGFLKGLRHQLPTAHITVFTSPCSESLYERCPYINQYVVCHPEKKLRKSFIKQYRGQFDMLINPRYAEDYYHSGQFALLLEVPVRVAFEQDDPALNVFYTDLVKARNDKHVAEYANILLNAMFGVRKKYVPEVWFNRFDEQQAQQKMVQAGWDGEETFVVVAPGASTDYRVWPLEHVASLIERLHDEFAMRVVLVGSPLERMQWQTLSTLCAEKFINVVGQFSLSELAACLKLAKLFIGTDSGPKHIAAAVGTPVVEIGYFPEDWPSLARGMWTSGPCWGPYNVRAELLRPASTWTREEAYSGKSIQSITPPQVLEAVKELC